jgi:MFS family permease
LFVNRTNLPNGRVEPEERQLKSDSRNWGAVGLIYAFTVLSMASVGVVIPLLGDLAQKLGADQASLGLSVALFSAPSAVLAGLGGGIIDRVGARGSLICCAFLAVVADLVAFGAPSLLFFDLGMLLAGVAFAGISISAPALIIASCSGSHRLHAMSFWSTYAPTGFSLGLYLAVPFAGSANWSWAILFHGALILVSVCFCGLLPKPEAGAAVDAHEIHGAAGFGQLLSAFRELRVLRLALTASLPSALAYGTSLVAPAYLGGLYRIGVGEASSIVALTNLAMIPGGILAGHLLARGLSSLALFRTIVLAGIVGQLMFFVPGTGVVVAVAGLVVWPLAMGAAMAIAMALLHTVVRDQSRSGAASGVVGQAISCMSFLAPPVYLGLLTKGGWLPFVVIAAVCLVIAVLALPARRLRAAEA